MITARGTHARPPTDAGAEIAERLARLDEEATVRDAVLDAMDDAVMLVEGDTVVFANDAARSLLGAVVGRAVPPGLPGDGATQVERHHPAHRILRAVSTPLPDGRRVVFTRDVTSTERLDAMRRDFVANASHELKTPVAGILATAETLPSAIKEDPDAAVRFATTLAREAARLSALVQDLLDLAKLEQPAPPAEAIDLSPIIGGLLDEATPSAAAKQITLEREVAASLPVLGRADELQQLVRNLVENAITYTPSGGTVTVRAMTDGSSVRLVVGDTGIGIPAKDLPRIFERFYRVDRARSRETGGTGLGLSIVRHIATAHGGTVEASSELGAGSTFTVTLPARG